jgi:hypothetical protein
MSEYSTFAPRPFSSVLELRAAKDGTASRFETLTIKFKEVKVMLCCNFRLFTQQCQHAVHEDPKIPAKLSCVAATAAAIIPTVLKVRSGCP